MKALSIYASLLIFSGCTSQVVSTDEHVRAYIGENITSAQALYLTPASQLSGPFEFKEYAWSETKEAFINGDVQHTFTNPYLDCTIFWITDKHGVIKSGSYIGEDCLR